MTFAAASATVAAFGAGDRLNFLSPAVSFSYSAMPNPGSVLQYGTLTVTEQSGFVVTVSLQDLYQHLPTDFAISNGGIVLRTKQPPVISGTSAGLQVTPAQMPADMACRPISSSWPRSMPGCLAVRLTRRG